MVVAGVEAVHARLGLLTGRLLARSRAAGAPAARDTGAAEAETVPFAVHWCALGRAGRRGACGAGCVGAWVCWAGYGS